MARKSKKVESELVNTSTASLEPVVLSEGRADEYAALKNDFSTIINRGMAGFQEKTEGRVLDHITVRLQGRYGFVVQTDKRGLISIPEMSGMEMDNQGNLRHQRINMGMNCSATTKKTVFASVNALRRGDTIIKEFEANAGAHELIKASIKRSQELGEEFQRELDEDEAEYFNRLSRDVGHEGSINWGAEEVINIDDVFKLISLARQTLKLELGAKLEDCQIVFFHIVDTTEISDTVGTAVDHAVPRTGISVVVTTTKGHKVFDSCRGIGGLEVLSRHDKTQTVFASVEALAKRLAKHANDMDRAQPCSVLGDEAYVLFNGAVAGVLAHEVIGHCSEFDIIVANKRNTDVDLNLKSRLGGQVSENNKLCIIDDGSREVKLGDKVISHCFGSVPIDEEGTPGARTVLVKSGIQQLGMNSADTFYEVQDGLNDIVVAKMRERGLTGNYRNERFDKPPMVRMTNTYILPDDEGADSIDELATMIPKNKKGVYLVTASGGWVETETGTFQITGQLGYLIENGIITDKPVKDIVINGNIMKFGSKIKALGNSNTITTSTGYCGKNQQWVPVEDGGPAVLVEDCPVGADRPSWFWEKNFKAYKQQMLEVAHKQRDESELFFDFVEDITEKKIRNHNNVCMFATNLEVKDEVDMLLSRDGMTADFILTANGTLEDC